MGCECVGLTGVKVMCGGGGVLIIVYNETLLSMGSSRGGVGLLYCVGGISLGVLLET
jgi:hypothetical protein